MRGQGNTRTRRMLVGVAAAGVALLVLPASPAAAVHETPPATETSGAQGLDAQGLVDVTSENVSCPPSPQDTEVVDLDVGTLASVDGIYANCDGNSSAAGAASATLGLGLLNLDGLNLGVLEAQCVDGVGSSSVVRLGGLLGQDETITEETTINLSPVITVVLNENTTQGDQVVQNAVHATILGEPGGDAVEEIIIGQARCDAAPSPIIPEAPLALLLPLSAVALFGGAFLVLRRRNAGVVA